MTVCHECRTVADETAGRWIILGEKTDGFEWVFMCTKCVRNWRQRGLVRAGHSIQSAKETLDKEYPLWRSKHLNWRIKRLPDCFKTARRQIHGRSCRGGIARCTGWNSARKGIQKGACVFCRVDLNLIIIDTTTQRDSVSYWDFLRPHYTLNFPDKKTYRKTLPDDCRPYGKYGRECEFGE